MNSGSEVRGLSLKNLREEESPLICWVSIVFLSKILTKEFIYNLNVMLLEFNTALIYSYIL